MPRGREGIIAVAEVTGPLTFNSSHQRYTDGTEATWASYAACARHDFGGYVDRKKVNKALGYKANYNLRGFAKGSGLKELSKGQFEELLREFKKNTPR